MFNFDVERFLKIESGAIALKDEINPVLDRLYEKGISSLFFLGSGGAGDLMRSAEFVMKQHSTLPVFTEISTEFLLMGHKHFNENSLVVVPSLSGTTEESVKVIEYCKEKGATVISLVGHADTPVANASDYAFVNFAEDDTSSESFYLQSYLVIFRLMHLRGEFDRYDQFVEELKAVPEALLAVKEAIEEKAEAFVTQYKDEAYHMVVGSGNSWPQAYYYAMCILEEMQWIKTKSIHASEFFHGTLELLEEDTSIIILKGEDVTRPLVDRVQNFAEKISKKVTVFDTKDFELKGISEEFRGYLSPAVLATLLERVSCHLEHQRNHPLTTRRYYRRMEY